MRRFCPIFILLLVTFWLTAGNVSAVQNEGGAAPWSQGDLRIDVSKKGSMPCVLVRPAVPLLVAEDPRAVVVVPPRFMPGFRSVIHAPLPHFNTEVPPPPSLTGRVVIRV